MKALYKYYLLLRRQKDINGAIEMLIFFYMPIRDFLE